MSRGPWRSGRDPAALELGPRAVVLELVPAIAGRQPGIGEMLSSTPGRVCHPAPAIGGPLAAARVCHSGAVYVIPCALDRRRPDNVHGEKMTYIQT